MCDEKYKNTQEGTLLNQSQNDYLGVNYNLLIKDQQTMIHIFTLMKNIYLEHRMLERFKQLFKIVDKISKDILKDAFVSTDKVTSIRDGELSNVRIQGNGVTRINMTYFNEI